VKWTGTCQISSVRNGVGSAAVVLAALVSASLALAIDTSSYRYERLLRGGATARPTLFGPDREMYGHAQLGFADLRIVDGAGREVPWRRVPVRTTPRRVPVRVVEAGRRGDAAVALFDLGPRRSLRTRLELDIPDTGFVARVAVLGTDDRRAYTLLSTSVIYDVEGVVGRARSTVVAFPPSDFRYLQLRARGVSRIAGAAAFRQMATSPGGLASGDWRPRTEGRTTRVDLDFGYPNVPVDLLGVSAETATYDRPVSVEGSNDGKKWELLASARIYRLPESFPAYGYHGPPATMIEIDGRHRFLRLTIDNGDDPPLDDVGVSASAFRRPLLAEGGHRGPVRVFYGNPSARPPVFDLTQLPVPGPREVAFGSVGPELLNPLFEPPRDSRSFAERHRLVVSGVLALVALGGVVAAAFILRRRA
jgi:hypothetical protein